ncbi:AlpA family transcriptional regulator [Vibrio algarum]|uniref:AlpA family transcriptional regulator n=1 Tax=Vibrio algarum TaxID=3020714 RepID=A0ABT4YME2_9VIBR|nr:AlpA family transcriptional regulator [Vibrio sp. KJ40-1]MDB1122234.1 AlpA family transcriptional regulator [Vibrio sp. KJ40-1]
MRFIRLKEVISKTGLSRSTIYSLIKEGRFPPNVPIGSRSVAWVESEVEEWLEESVQVRDKAAKGYFDGYGY